MGPCANMRGFIPGDVDTGDHSWDVCGEFDRWWAVVMPDGVATFCCEFRVENSNSMSKSRFRIRRQLDRQNQWQYGDACLGTRRMETLNSMGRRKKRTERQRQYCQRGRTKRGWGRREKTDITLLVQKKLQGMSKREPCGSGKSVDWNKTMIDDMQRTLR